MTARATLLRQLPTNGFVPAEATVPWSTVARGAAFAADVEAFAAAFWSLAPRERRSRWEALLIRGVGPAVARLAGLMDGLDVTPTPSSRPEAVELSRVVRELFPLPPRERATRRREWQMRAKPLGVWAAVTREFATADRATARLDPVLLLQLEGGVWTAPVPPDDTVVADTRTAVGGASGIGTAEPAIRNKTEGFLVFVAAIVIGGVIAVVLHSAKQDRSNRAINPDFMNSPGVRDGTFMKEWDRLSPGQLPEPTAPHNLPPLPAPTPR